MSRLTLATLKCRMNLACPTMLCLADKDNEPGSFRTMFPDFDFFRCLRRASADVRSHPVARWLSDALIRGPRFVGVAASIKKSVNNCCFDSRRLKQLAAAWRWPGLQTCTEWLGGRFEVPLIWFSTLQFQSCALCCLCCLCCSVVAQASGAPCELPNKVMQRGCKIWARHGAAAKGLSQWAHLGATGLCKKTCCLFPSGRPRADALRAG